MLEPIRPPKPRIVIKADCVILDTGHVDVLHDDWASALADAERICRDWRTRMAAFLADFGAHGMMQGEVRAIALEDGVERDASCGLENCECPEHDYVPPAGVYLTIRLDDKSAPVRGAHLGPVVLTWPDV
jgi:hypothetical protein